MVQMYRCSTILSDPNHPSMAKDNAPSQETKSIVRKAFYVDISFMEQTPSMTVNANIIKATLEAGQFPLSKWMSNRKETLPDITAQEYILHLCFQQTAQIKLLALGVPYSFDDDDSI